jgi:hypothetical protein
MRRSGLSVDILSITSLMILLSFCFGWRLLACVLATSSRCVSHQVLYSAITCRITIWRGMNDGPMEDMSVLRVHHKPERQPSLHLCFLVSCDQISIQQTDSPQTVGANTKLEHAPDLGWKYVAENEAPRLVEKQRAEFCCKLPLFSGPNRRDVDLRDCLVTEADLCFGGRYHRCEVVVRVEPIGRGHWRCRLGSWPSCSPGAAVLPNRLDSRRC